MRTEIIMGRKLRQRADGWWVDDYGTVYDWHAGKLYEQRRPGVWFWIRPDAQTRALEQPRAKDERYQDAVLDNLIGGF